MLNHVWNFQILGIHSPSIAIFCRTTEQLPDIWENVLSHVSGTRSHAGPFQDSRMSTVVPWPLRAILGQVTSTPGLLSKVVTWLWPSSSLSVLSYSFCLVSVSSDHNQYRYCSRDSSLCFVIVILIWLRSSNTIVSLAVHNQMMLRCIPPAMTLHWAPDVDNLPSLWCLLLDDPGTLKTTFPRLKAAFPLPAKTVHLSLHKWNGSTTHPFLQNTNLTTSPAFLAITVTNNCHLPATEKGTSMFWSGTKLLIPLLIHFVYSFCW